MEIYVSKKRNSIIKKIKTKESFSYDLNFHENGYVSKEHFQTYSELFKRLRNENIYLQNKFPYMLLDIDEFIKIGFSIYY
jgi:hypothetical protein